MWFSRQHPRGTSRQLQNTWDCRINLLTEKKCRDFNGIRTHGLCVSAAMLYHLSYEGLTLGAGQFVEFIFTVKEMKYEKDVSSWHRNTNFKWGYDRRSGNCNYHLLGTTSWLFPWNSPLQTVLVKAVNVHFNESRKKLCDYFVLLYCN